MGNNRKDLNRRTSITDADENFLMNSIKAKRDIGTWWKDSTGKAEITDSPIDMLLMSGPLDIAGKILKTTKSLSVFGSTLGVAIPYAGKKLNDFGDFITNKNTEMKKYALGSPFAIPNGEVEGGEAIETPNAETATEIKGPKHSQGGVPLAIPTGSEIYSDQLKIEGKTIAERKLARDRRLAQIEKVFEKNKSDLIGKKSLDRTKQANDFQDEKDLAFQEAVKNIVVSTAKSSMKFALGDDGKDDLLALPEYPWGTDSFGKIVWLDDELQPNSGGRMGFVANGMSDAGYNSAPTEIPRDQAPNLMIPKLNSSPIVSTKPASAPTLAPMKTNPTTPDPTKPNVGMGFTAGDYVGMAGMAIGSISQMMNTINNAKATKPVVNHYAGFNEKALQANAEYEDQIAYNKNITETGAERDLTLAENTARARLRNSASGISTLRSLDVATDYNANETKIKSTNQLEGVFGQQKAQAESQKVGLLSQKDQMEMAGQERADAGNAANLDAFYTNFSQNLAGMTQNIQTLGKDINTAKSRNDFLKILPKTNAWGVGLDQNMDEYIEPRAGSPVGVSAAYGRSASAGKKSVTKSYGALFPWDDPNNPLMQPVKLKKPTYNPFG